MKRIYLDQNKWIDLAKAAVNHEQGKPFQEILEKAQSAVEHGLATFPLSQAHYIENYKAEKAKWKESLGQVMLSLSRFYGMAPMMTLLLSEIDKALREIFPKIAKEPRSVEIFGVGVDHIFGQSILEPPPSELNVGDDGSSAKYKELMEFLLLLGPPPAVAAQIPEFENLDPMGVAAMWAKGQEDQRLRLKLEGWHRRERVQKFAIASTLIGFEVPINEALRRIDKSWDDLMDMGRAGLAELYDSVPIINVFGELARIRYGEERSWEPNDMTDFGFLPPAIVHCDVVVTENMWVNDAKRASLDRKYSTVMLADVRDLANFLA